MNERVFELSPLVRLYMEQVLGREAMLFGLLTSFEEENRNKIKNKEETMKKMYGMEQEKEFWNVREAVSMYETIERSNSRKISSVLFPKENGLYIKVLRADNGVLIAEDNYKPTDEEMSKRKKMNEEDIKQPKEENEIEKVEVPEELRKAIMQSNETKPALDRPTFRNPLRGKFREHKINDRLSKLKKCKGGECKHNEDLKYKQPEAPKPVGDDVYFCSKCGAVNKTLNNFYILPSGEFSGKVVLCNSCFNKMFGELKPAIGRRLRISILDKAPSHYKALIQPVEAIQMWGLDFTIGNIVKYAARVGKKKGVDPVDDLNKIIRYAEIAKEEILNKRGTK